MIVFAEEENTPVMSTTRSIDYARVMGIGWNLGNTLDGRGGGDPEGWETSWGNPVTTREFIQSIADRGFEHIRIPFTIDDRHTDLGADTPDGELRYVIHQEWLDRYVELVEWSLDAGLIVMINIHHDNWIWLSRGSNSWDGDPASWQYRRFTDHWVQLSEAFTHMPDTVMFETINEPEFNSVQQRLDDMNRAVVEIIRSTPGNEERIIVIPTYETNHESKNSSATRNFIRSLNDEHIIATVHYYCDWLFSTNIGITLFDEQTAGRSAREAVDSFYETINKYFLSEGIGVSVGEWGLLAYDNGNDILQTGEELKYYEYMYAMSRMFEGVSLTFWDNGSGIDRRDAPDFGWRQPKLGAMLEGSIHARSSYSVGLDTLYFTDYVTNDVEIPLMLNGNEFTGIEGLSSGFKFDEASETLTLEAEWLNSVMGGGFHDLRGVFKTLTLQFSAGADWQMYLVSLGTPEYGLAAGTRSTGISIPVSFNGAHIRNIAASQNGRQVGGTSLWWRYLHNGEAFRVNYESGYLTLLGNFFSDSVKEGEVELTINYFHGESEALIIDVLGESGGAAVTTVPAPELSSLLPMDIFSLTYNFLIENVTANESIHFEMISDNWPAHINAIDIDGDGLYSFTLEFRGGVAGLIHLGFVRVIADSEVTITVESIIVNDEIELMFAAPFVMQLGNGKYNTLPHRWYMNDGGLINGEPLYDGRTLMTSDCGEYWFEFHAGVNDVETAVIVLYHQSADIGDTSEADKEDDDEDEPAAIPVIAEPAASDEDEGMNMVVVIGVGFALLSTIGAVVFMSVRRKAR